MIKIGENKYIFLKNIEAMHIIKKQFPKQDLFDENKFDSNTNVLKIEIGYSMEFTGTSGEKYSGYVFKSAAQLMAWWNKAILGEIENERN